jgi:hypothetical protein
MVLALNEGFESIFATLIMYSKQNHHNHNLNNIHGIIY